MDREIDEWMDLYMNGWSWTYELVEIVEWMEDCKTKWMNRKMDRWMEKSINWKINDG